MNQEIHTHLEKLKTELSKLEPAVKHLQDADRNTASLIELTAKLTLIANSVTQIYDKLVESNEKLLDDINKIDFPKRFDKLDATVSSINQGLQNTQTRIGDLERNIKDDLMAKTKDLISKVETIESNLKQKFEKQSMVNKLLKILLFVSLALSIGILILKFF
jgi:uncharacterized phage infection (PIP) family protein YhgE